MTALPPLNTPIQHTGGATCPVHIDTRVKLNEREHIWTAGRVVWWPDVTTYTIIARAPADQMVELRSTITELEAALIDAAASLAAAISLLERGGKTAKKAAASDKMFDQMLDDYRGSFERARATLKGKTDV